MLVFETKQTICPLKIQLSHIETYVEHEQNEMENIRRLLLRGQCARKSGRLTITVLFWWKFCRTPHAYKVLWRILHVYNYFLFFKYKTFYIKWFIRNTKYVNWKCFIFIYIEQIG